MHCTRIGLHALMVMVLTTHCGAFDRMPSRQTALNFLKEKRADASNWLRDLPTTIPKKSAQYFSDTKIYATNNPIKSSAVGLLFLAGVAVCWQRAAIAKTEKWQKTSAYVGKTTQEIKKRLVLCWGALTGAVGSELAAKDAAIGTRDATILDREAKLKASNDALDVLRPQLLAQQRDVYNLNANAEHLDTTVGYLESDKVKLQEQLDESETARREMFEKHKKEVEDLNRDKTVLKAQLDARMVVPQLVPHVAPQPSIPQQTQPVVPPTVESQQPTSSSSTSSTASSSSEQGIVGATVGVVKGVFGFMKDIWQDE